VTREARASARAQYGIGEHQLCIGSFHKDGDGWGDGNTPKMIKGPDILLQTIARVARERPVFVLLTGPARGFVKQGLAKLGVPFAHDWVDDYRDLPARYAALDAYLNPSREEGGPKGLLEAMASGVPVVSTRVGMAPDVIASGTSGDLAEVGDDEALARAILALPGGEALHARRAAARDAVAACAWRIVGRQHLEQVYRPLL
jgi:glycosyltransferase involved in cell wall biosynthesis